MTERGTFGIKGKGDTALISLALRERVTLHDFTLPAGEGDTALLSLALRERDKGRGG